MTVNVEDIADAERFYEELLAKIENGKLVAVIPAMHDGVVGTWMTTYAVEPDHINSDESALMAAMIAVNMTRRRARENGVLPL